MPDYDICGLCGCINDGHEPQHFDDCPRIDVKQLKIAVEETTRYVGKIDAIHCFCNYLADIGHNEAAEMLVKLKEDILNEQGTQ